MHALGFPRGSARASDVGEALRNCFSHCKVTARDLRAACTTALLAEWEWGRRGRGDYIPGFSCTPSLWVRSPLFMRHERLPPNIDMRYAAVFSIRC